MFVTSKALPPPFFLGKITKGSRLWYVVSPIWTQASTELKQSTLRNNHCFNTFQSSPRPHSFLESDRINCKQTTVRVGLICSRSYSSEKVSAMQKRFSVFWGPVLTPDIIIQLHGGLFPELTSFTNSPQPLK